MITGKILYLIGIPAWILIRGTRLFTNTKRKTKNSTLREVILSIFVLYLISLANVTLLPIRTKLFEGLALRDTFKAISYIPFTSISSLINDGYFSCGFAINLVIKNLGGNLILLMPLSILSSLLFSKCKKGKMNIFTCFITSILIEVLQLVENLIGVGVGRICDIDDVIMNTLGAFLAFCMFNVLLNIYQKNLKKGWQNNAFL